MKNSQTQAPFDTNHALRGGDVPPTTSQHCKRKKHIQGGASAHVHLEESWMSIKELLKLCKKQSHIYIWRKKVNHSELAVTVSFIQSNTSLEHSSWLKGRLHTT